MREGLRSGKLREGLRSGRLRKRPRKGEISSRKDKSLPKLIVVRKNDESCMESTKLDSVSGCHSCEGIDECQTNGILQYRRKRVWDDNGEGRACLGEENMIKKGKKEISACEVQNVDRVLRSRTRSGSDFKKEVEIAESGCTEIDTSGGQNDNFLVKNEDDGANQPVEGLVEQKVKKKRGRPPKIRSDIMVMKNKLDRTKKKGAPRKGKKMLKSKGGLDRGVTISSPKRSKRWEGTDSSLKLLTLAKQDNIENLETGGKVASSQESSERGNNKENVVKPVIKTENSVVEGLTRASEKKLVRDRIIELLLSAGWTIDYRPRNGRDYDDAVYVSLDGKTHWSVTKAYRLLKQRYENGDREAYKEGFVFLPIPTEELSILNKVFTKKREGRKANGNQESRIRADRAARKKKGKHSSVVTSSGKSIRRKKKGKSIPHEECDSTMEALYRTPSSFGKRKRRDTKCSKRCTFLVRSSGGQDSESNGYVLYKGKRTTLAWMIDLGIVLEKANVSYMNQEKTEVMLEGKITRDGIDCNCCGKVITISEFESHAGSKLCQALQCTYLHDGISIVQCFSEACKKQEKTMRQKWFYYIDISGDDMNDDTCGLCGDGGNLVCCDGCPSTFHQSCLDIQKFPPGDWHCLFCSCKFCGMIFENANGREEDAKAAALLLTCAFCKERYHRSCSDAKDATEGIEASPSFCGEKCQEIYGKVDMLLGVKHELEEGFSWTLLNRSDVDVDLSSKETSRKVESNCKIAVALSVMDECFLPMPDHRSGINLIHNIMYNCGSNFNRLDFSRFYTVTLEKGEEIIAAATIRMHGNVLAEMPFIGTRYMYRRQGMCRRLLHAIELVLCSLDVEKLVIPAVSDLEETWTSAFGFEPLDIETQRTVKRLSLLVFPGVAMLQKLVMSSDDGFNREKQNHAAEGSVSSSCEDVQTTGDAVDLAGGNSLSLVSLDLNVAAASEEGELATTNNCQLPLLPNGASSDITTGLPSCATDDSREVAVVPSAAGVSESSAGENDVNGEVKNVDASATLDQNDGCVATPPIAVLDAAAEHEEDGLLGMSSGGVCRDVQTVMMSPAETETCVGRVMDSGAALEDLSSTDTGELLTNLEGPLGGRMSNVCDEMNQVEDDALNIDRPTLEGEMNDNGEKKSSKEDEEHEQAAPPNEEAAADIICKGEW